jgi:sulfide:quinone oxidoreductase
MPARVVVLGGGVGGTLTANLLDKTLAGDAHVTVVDPSGMHDYQPGYLYVALGEASGHWLSRDERTLLRSGVDLAIEKVVRIHPEAQTVQLERGGSMEWDYLVIATGARLVHDAVPGLVEGAYGFYSLPDAERLREALRTFKGGRVRIGIAGIPYKCPPAPVEFTFQLTTFFNVEAVDPSAGTVESLEGEKVEYDLLVLVPPHKGAQVVIDSDLGDAGGWLPTDKHTLQVGEHERIFALGDATNLPISKSGSTAHFEAPVIASRIASLIKGTAPKTNYGGRVMCFLETGNGKATALRFDYEHPPVPPQPNRAWHVAKWMFNRVYWQTVPQGRLPERAPGTMPKKTKPKETKEDER